MHLCQYIHQEYCLRQLTNSIKKPQPSLPCSTLLAWLAPLLKPSIGMPSVTIQIIKPLQACLFCMLVINNQSGVSTMFMITAHVLILTLPISLKFNYSNIIIPFKDLNQVEVNIIQALSEPNCTQRV